jgi:hypothetical protein
VLSQSDIQGLFAVVGAATPPRIKELFGPRAGLLLKLRHYQSPGVVAIPAKYGYDHGKIVTYSPAIRKVYAPDDRQL